MKIQLALLVGAMLLVAGVTAYAHHPFSAEYDWTKPVTISGSVTKLEWTNPHAVLYVDGKDENGQMKHWVLEMGNPGALTRAGWNRNMVKQGDQVTIDAWMGKSDPSRANVKSVKLPNGKEVSGGSSILDMKQDKSSKPVSN